MFQKGNFSVMVAKTNDLLVNINYLYLKGTLYLRLFQPFITNVHVVILLHIYVAAGVSPFIHWQ